MLNVLLFVLRLLFFGAQVGCFSFSVWRYSVRFSEERTIGVTSFIIRSFFRMTVRKFSALFRMLFRLSKNKTYNITISFTHLTCYNDGRFIAATPHAPLFRTLGSSAQLVRLSEDKTSSATTTSFTGR